MRIHPFLLSLLFFVFPSLIVGHTIISRPTPRENTVHTNASPFECGASTAIANTYTRGQVIPFQWGRNNHYGGFVQASVLPMAQARDIYSTATRDAFDNPANIVHVSCYNQPSCQACQGCSDGFYGTGGDGTNFQQNLCNTQMTIPNYLPDGDYVMKIVVFGNGDSFGVRNMPHSSYSNCHNFRVAGGGAVQAKAAGNRHIEWGAGNAGLSDHGITLINRNKGLNLAQGRCGFMGTNTHMGCVPVNGVRSPTCTGPVATLTKCGNAGVDNRQQCLGQNNEDQAQRGDLYNYILGLPAYHPDYRGDFTLLSYATQTVRQISLNAGGNTGGGNNNGGGNTGGGNTGGGAATGTCEANGNCRANPGCCGAGKLCYEKDQFYAGCYDINTCTPGIHQGDPAEYRTPWSCLVLGTQANTAGAFGIYWKSRLDRVVDVAGATNTNGNQVWMYENYGPGPAQRFEWVNGEQIRWQGTDKCLDVPGGNNQNGVGLIIWQCDPANPNQKFARNGERIEWKGSGRCLDVNAGGTTLGTKLQIWDCDENNPNQQFVLQPLVRSGSAFVNTKALDSAMSLMTAVKKELIWMQGRPVIDSDSNIETSFLVVPVGSEIDFHGASSTNIVKQVCLELFEKGGKTNPCSPQDDPVVTLKEEQGKVFFWTTTPGDYYFMGTTVKDPTSLSINQRVRISFVQALSSAEVANTINEADLDGDGELDPTTRPPRPTYARSSASSLQTGFMAIISVGVAFFFMKF